MSTNPPDQPAPGSEHPDEERKQEPEKADNGIWKTVLGIRKPIQLVAFLLAVVSVYWINRLGLSSTQGVVVLIVFVITVIAVIFLFYIDQVKEEQRPWLLIIMFLVIVAALLYVISLFFSGSGNKSPGPTIFSFKLNLRDEKQGNFKDFRRIRIMEESLTDTGLKNYDNSYIMYRVLGNPAKPHLKFSIKTPDYVFDNNTYQKEFTISGTDTEIVLKQLAQPPKVVAKNTFNIKPYNNAVINRMHKQVPSVQYSNSAASYYQMTLSNYKSSISQDTDDPLWSIDRTPVYIEVQGRQYPIGNIKPASQLEKADIEKYVAQAVNHLIANANFKKMIDEN